MTLLTSLVTFSVAEAEVFPPDIEWEKTFGGSDDGGYIVAGDTLSYGAGSCDIWLIKPGRVGIENQPPAPKIDGPYQGNEGSSITFNASGSYDPDGDTLQYRWDFDNDGTWDTEWSDSPYASYTWCDDWSGTAKLEVSDGELTDTDTASVTVSNVAPTVAAGDDQTVNEGDTVSFSGSFTDPGADTHTIEWDFGDGTIVPGSLTEENEQPDATGTTTATHTRKPNTPSTIISKACQMTPLMAQRLKERMPWPTSLLR